MKTFPPVMAGLVQAIPSYLQSFKRNKDVDARHNAGHDAPEIQFR